MSEWPETTTPGATPGSATPRQLVESLTAHADAIAFRLLGDAELAAEVARDAAEEVSADLDATGGYPLAFVAARAVAASLAAAPRINPALADPYRAERQDLRARFELTPVASSTLVALGCLCGYDDAAVAELSRRPAEAVTTMLARARPDVRTALLGDRRAVTSTSTTPHPEPPGPSLPPEQPASPESSAARDAAPTAVPAPPPAVPVGRAPRRRRRRIRLSTIVSVVLIAGSVWAVTHDGGERPSFADVPAPTGLGTGGCEVAPDLPLGAPQAETIVVSGATRQYLVRVPTQLRPGKRIPLLVDLGDYGESAEARLEASGWGAIADQQGMAVAVLQADGSLPQWNVASAPNRPDDTAFARAVIGRLQNRLCIDSARVWLSGMGNGAQMAGALQCQLSDVVSATVMVAGIGTTKTCTPTKPIAVSITVFDDDDVLPPDGGYGPGLLRILGAPDAILSGAVAEPPAADAALASWAGAAGCGNAPVASKAVGDVRQLAYTDCRGGTTVLLRRWTGPRRWDQTTASATIDFLSAQPLR